MAKTNPDFINPRQILIELHKILRNDTGSKISNKDLSRWKNNKEIGEEKRSHIRQVLNKEIIGFLAALFPVKSYDGVNFHCSGSAHKYVGQLFSFIVLETYYFELLPLLRTWESE
ncbi:MAG: hypothetical protein AAFW89_02660, partial [Bacteroidota bacterium]